MSTVPPIEAVDVQIGDRIEDMICDLGQKGFCQAHAPYYEKLETDSKKPLYLGCTTFTRLSGVLALVNLKARFRWSDNSFIELLLLLKNMLPEDNTLPKNHYEAKKILCLVGMCHTLISFGDHLFVGIQPSFDHFEVLGTHR